MKKTLAAALLAGGLAVAGCQFSAPPQEAANSSPAPQAQRQSEPTAALPLPRGQDGYADVVSRVSPAVVTIHSERRVRAPQQYPFFEDPVLQHFFGQQAPPQREFRAQGLGSGVIVSEDGLILTNHHVVDGAQDIQVELTDHRSYTAKLIGSDPPSDLAVLKIEDKDLPHLQLGDSDKVRVGDMALAVGNPLGVGQTVTMGIISAKGRSTGLSDGSFEDFLQTDAPINQGNSGGALVNTRGELIGINSQIMSPSGGNIGIGFAIPANMAKNVMEQLVETGRVRRGMLGVTISPSPKGALVNSIQPGGPAERAGLQPGDLVVAFNGERIFDSNTLRNRIAATGPDKTVRLTVQRGSQETEVEVRLAELPDAGFKR